MNRTKDFFNHFSQGFEINSANQVLKQRTRSHFTEASLSIAETIKTINKSIEEIIPSFIDQYNPILSKSSMMTNRERELFIEETKNSLQSVEKLVAELAQKVNSGKMGLKGDAINHSIGVSYEKFSSTTKCENQFPFESSRFAVNLSNHYFTLNQFMSSCFHILLP